MILTIFLSGMVVSILIDLLCYRTVLEGHYQIHEVQS